jgi:arsenate reductase
MHVTVYHHSRCSKSRNALDSIKRAFKSIQIIEYQKQPLNKQEIKELMHKLNLPAEAIIRKKELVWQTQFANKQLSEAELIEAIAIYPALMERPIVVCNNKGCIARSENVINEILRLTR